MPMIKDNGEKNKILVHPSAVVDPKVRIIISGSGNRINIGQKAVLRDPCLIAIDGDENDLDIGDHCNLRGAFHLRQRGSSISIGHGSSTVNAGIYALEGKRITIGEGCMFSSGIFIRNSDEHSIFDKATGERINPAKDITISDRVWLSEGVTVAKGVTIAPDCVVGARSYVGKSLQTPNAIYAGTPAKLVRENVVWHRRLLEKLDIA